MGKGRKSIAEIAAEHLRETDNPGVIATDYALLHEIAEKAGVPQEGPKTPRRIINAIDRTYRGHLEKRLIRGHRILRSFWLLDRCEQ